MAETSSLRLVSGRRVRFARISVCLLCTTLLLALAILSGLSSRRASAQVPPSPAQPPATGAISPSGLGTPTIAGSVLPPETAAKEKAEEPPTAAEKLVDEALAKIAKLQYVSAELVEDVQMLREKLTITGRYLKAPNARVYCLLTVKQGGLPDTEGTTLQVCDGETFWDYQQVLNSQLYRKFSVKPVLERLNSPDLDPKIKEQAMTQMGLAGPETLLVGLRRTIRFEHKEEGQLDGKKVWILRGTWKSRQGLAGPDGRPVMPSGLLPPYIPSDASLYLGKDDGWPYKLVLMGRPLSVLLDTRKVGPDGRKIGSLSSIERPTPTKITLEYTDVKLNAAIRIDRFAFTAPPTAQVEDNTEVIVRMLDQGIAMQAQRKKDEAAKKEGQVLEQPIEVPRP
jgi:outer membrane lipoprotein-sorting protein